jgi:hypothetical protein
MIRESGKVEGAGTPSGEKDTQHAPSQVAAAPSDLFHNSEERNWKIKRVSADKSLLLCSANLPISNSRTGIPAFLKRAAMRTRNNQKFHKILLCAPNAGATRPARTQSSRRVPA